MKIDENRQDGVKCKHIIGKCQVKKIVWNIFCRDFYTVVSAQPVYWQTLELKVAPYNFHELHTPPPSIEQCTPPPHPPPMASPRGTSGNAHSIHLDALVLSQIGTLSLVGMVTTNFLPCILNWISNTILYLPMYSTITSRWKASNNLGSFMPRLSNNRQ